MTTWRVGVLLAFSVTASAAKSPITHEAMWLMKPVGAPVVSPDGNWVVFSVTQPAYDPKGQESDLWIVAADGAGKPRRLTFSKRAGRGVAWSPDSRRFGFFGQARGG